MKVITAPEKYEHKKGDVLVFLAGGITYCWLWQNVVIEYLEKLDKRYSLERLILLNPRREKFPIDKPDAAREQIEWEFDWLEKCDIFSMYFCGGHDTSVQPICMYELGRNLYGMKDEYPYTYKDRTVISVEEGYKRTDDVMIQAELAGYNGLVLTGKDYRDLAEMHAARIADAYERIIGRRHT